MSAEEKEPYNEKVRRPVPRASLTHAEQGCQGQVRGGVQGAGHRPQGQEGEEDASREEAQEVEEEQVFCR